MPPWGRPSWGDKGGSSSNRRRKEWERQQREWESSRRFEELDSGSDVDEGFGLHYRQEESDSEASGLDDDFNEPGDMQVALRDKEDVLLARAMMRIRRAQELGKENVKLTPGESEALERKMAKDRAKGRKPIIETERIPSKKTARKSLPPATTSRKRESRLSLGQGEQYLDRPRSRRASTQNLQQLQPPRRRPLPDEPNWRPRSSSSTHALPYPISPQDAQHRYDYPQPSAAGYRSSSSRHVSGPADADYPRLPPYPTNMPSHRAYASSSDPALGRRLASSSSNASRRRDQDSDEDEDNDNDDQDEADEDDDDADQGVQVDVVPTSSAQGYEVVSRNQGTGGRASQASSLGRRRGGAKRW